MKNIAVVVFFIFQLPNVNYAQSYDDSVLRQQSYLFEHFIDGTVLLKSGEINYAPLNYCGTDQTILFTKDGKVFTLTGLSTVDTIFISDKKFVPVKNTIYEVENSEGQVKLYATYTTKMKPLTATADHSGTSRQNAGQVNNAVSNVYVSRNYKGDFTFEITKHYWLCEYKNISKANNLKDFLKVFKESTNSAIVDYVNKNNPDFKNESELIKLVNFCNKQ
ncbi:MAG: hypothetical protein ABIQ31_00840 [Ferruginibacter sp.]